MLTKRLQTKLMLALTLTLFVPGSIAWGQGRARVAVLNFESNAAVDRNVTDTLVDMITETLVKANKFDLVERSKLSSVTNEQLLGASGAVDAASAAQIGKITGADYLLYGKVTEAGTSTQQTRVGNVRTAKSVAMLAIDIRFIDATTSVVKFAESYKRSRQTVQVASTKTHFDISRGDAGALAREVIRELTREVLSAIYPPQVMKFTEGTGTVVLNYGDSMFSSGETWTIFHRGEELIDPATGEVLDYDEEEVGVVTISSTTDKVSRGTVVGTAQVGDICRFKSDAPRGPAPQDRDKVDPF